ncbi:hypothetical protein JCM17961_16190 [Endothiovibrio diazotrophicus]
MGIGALWGLRLFGRCRGRGNNAAPVRVGAVAPTYGNVPVLPPGLKLPVGRRYRADANGGSGIAGTSGLAECFVCSEGIGTAVAEVPPFASAR